MAFYTECKADLIRRILCVTSEHDGSVLITDLSFRIKADFDDGAYSGWDGFFWEVYGGTGASDFIGLYDQRRISFVLKGEFHLDDFAFHHLTQADDFVLKLKFRLLAKCQGGI